MEINYNQLNERIMNMNTQTVDTTNSVITINKKNKSILTSLEDVMLEIEILKSKLVERDVKIKELSKENTTLKAELDIASENKSLVKDYIKNIDYELGKLPSTRDLPRKIELVRIFVEYALSIYDILDSLPFKPSIRFGYKDRNKFVKYMLEHSKKEVSDFYIGYCNKFEEKYPDGLPKEGMLHNSGYKIKTLDNFIEYCI